MTTKKLAFPALEKLMLFALVVFIFSACRKEKVQLAPGEITSFKIEAAHNSAYLSEDVTGKIENKNITFKLPTGVNLNRLVATFVFNGKSVSVNGVNQISGNTENNFTQPLAYKVLGADNNIITYNVSVETFTDAALTLTDIGFQRMKNSFLPKDYSFNFREDSVLTTLSPLFGKTIIPTISTTATSILINGNVYSAETAIDFSNPVKLTLVSATGFKKTYILKVNWATEIPHIYINTTGVAHQLFQKMIISPQP